VENLTFFAENKAFVVENMTFFTENKTFVAENTTFFVENMTFFASFFKLLGSYLLNLYTILSFQEQYSNAVYNSLILVCTPWHFGR
jgi:hypothetical protein